MKYKIEKNTVQETLIIPFYIDRWARYAKVEISGVPGFSGMSVPQIGAERKNWKDETFFRE